MYHFKTTVLKLAYRLYGEKEYEVIKMTVKTSYGKITASKETLNELLLIFQEASENYEKRGRMALASQAMETSLEIYEILGMDGYYKD